MSADKTGRSLEHAVGRIQQMMDPGSSVSYRERIKNRLGIEREFDVVVRGHFGGHGVLCVIECKDWAGKVGTPELDAFITKSGDINANLRIIVSGKGFAEPALRQAEDAGVGLLSLLPEDPADAGFSIGVLWYARVYSWENMEMQLRFSGSGPDKSSYGAEDVLYNGMSVVNWFLKELSTTYGTLVSCGPFVLNAQFNAPATFTIMGRPYIVAEATVLAERICRKKTRFMQMTGDAFFNWQSGTLSVPANGAITVHGFRSDLSDWEDYDGEIPSTGPYQFVIDRFWNCVDLDRASIPDIAAI